MRTTKILHASLLPAALLFLSVTSYGQFKKGSTLLGGDISFSMQKSENLISASDNKTNAFYISPVFAKATRDNFFWGGSLGYGTTKSTGNGTTETKTQNYFASVFARKYKSLIGRFNAFVQGGITGGVIDGESRLGNSYDVHSKGFTVYASLTPGISVGVSKKLYLEAGFANIAKVGYSQQKQTGTSGGSNFDQKASSFNFSSSLSAESGGLYFGFRFILPK